MPIYVYRCNSCNHQFEELRPLGDHLITCPECTTDSLRPVPQPVTHRWALPWRMRGSSDVTAGHSEQMTERAAVAYDAEE